MTPGGRGRTAVVAAGFTLAASSVCLREILCRGKPHTMQPVKACDTVALAGPIPAICVTTETAITPDPQPLGFSPSDAH
jgi:hypothetical protein